MLHIKSNNEPVIGVNSTEGNSRVLGNLSFISGNAVFEVSPQDSNNLVFKDKWSSLESSYIANQINHDNTVDNTESLTLMSFDGSANVFLDINTEHQMKYYYNSALLKLTRNNDQHERETDAFSVRVAHHTLCSAMPTGETIQRSATFKTATVADESILNYKFTPLAFVGRGWDYIRFFDQNNNAIDRMNISAIGPDGNNSTNWVDFYEEQTFVKDDIKYHVHDCYLKKVGTNTELRSATIIFTNSGTFNITFDDKIALAYKNLAANKKLRIRFVFAVTRIAPLGQAIPIPEAFVPSTKLARPSKLVSHTLSEDGTRGTFTFNRQCYVSAYDSGVQVTDRVLTTTDGSITINFSRNLNEGASLELRVSTAFPQDEYEIYSLTIADTVAPPPITASIFLNTRIFGQGGSANDLAVAERDGVEIGRANISPTLDYIITLNEGITLTTGEIIEVYAMDTAGNKSESEIYEIEVSLSADGAFSPNLGNDSLTSVTTVST